MPFDPIADRRGLLLGQVPAAGLGEQVGGEARLLSTPAVGAPVDPRSCEEAKAHRLELLGLPSQPFLGAVGSGEHRLGTDDQRGHSAWSLGTWATLSPALHPSGSSLSSKAGIRPHVRAHG